MAVRLLAWLSELDKNNRKTKEKQNEEAKRYDCLKQKIKRLKSKVQKQNEKGVKRESKKEQRINGKKNFTSKKDNGENMTKGKRPKGSKTRRENEQKRQKA